MLYIVSVCYEWDVTKVHACEGRQANTFGNTVHERGGLK